MRTYYSRYEIWLHFCFLKSFATFYYFHFWSENFKKDLPRRYAISGFLCILRFDFLFSSVSFLLSFHSMIFNSKLHTHNLFLTLRAEFSFVFSFVFHLFISFFFCAFHYVAPSLCGIKRVARLYSVFDR